MGRSKLPIKKIENITNRQVTFSKRRYGLIKKAYEIAVLCDIDLMLIMLSPSGRLSHFSGKKRLEDVIYRYINLSDRDRGGIVENREQIINTLMKIKSDKDLAMESSATPGSDAEEIQKQIQSLQSQLEHAKAQLRLYEPDSEKFTTLEEFQSCERTLVQTLRCVIQRKRDLLSEAGEQSSYQDTMQTINSVFQYIDEAQVVGDIPSLELDQENHNGIELNSVDHMNFGSDVSSGNLRACSYDPLSQTCGNESAQTFEKYCQNSNIPCNDGSFQHIIQNPKDIFTPLMQADESLTTVMESSPRGLITQLDQEAVFFTSEGHHLTSSSELHL